MVIRCLLIAVEAMIEDDEQDAAEARIRGFSQSGSAVLNGVAFPAAHDGKNGPVVVSASSTVDDDYAARDFLSRAALRSFSSCRCRLPICFWK